MIVHSFPGRFRLRHPALCGAAALDRACGILRGLPGVSGVSGSAATGSLLVRCDETLDAAVAAAALQGVCASAVAAKRPRPAPRSWHKAVKAGMGGLLGVSLLLLAGGSERWHAVAGFGFLAGLAAHLGLNRNRLTL